MSIAWSSIPKTDCMQPGDSQALCIVLENQWQAEPSLHLSGSVQCQVLNKSMVTLGASSKRVVRLV
eukprot:1529680-Amphidinium_carterae.1